MLTVDHVVALATDPASLAAGRSLARPANWTSTGRDAVLLWGLCRGSGAQPYRVVVEHASTEYACSCPSRKFPCKHTIALLLLAATGDVATGRAPDFALDWFVKREAKRRANDAPEAAVSPDDAARDAAAAAAAKRAQARDARVSAGLVDLDRWLGDVMRLGLAVAQAEPPAFWHAKAARLVDAQAPALARRVRAIGELAARGNVRPDALARALGTLYSLREAYGRLGELSPARRADVRRYVGFTQREEDALARPDARVRDRWTIVGARSEDEERLVAHRAWIVGARTHRVALVLQFAVPGATTVPLAAAVPVGSAFDGAIAYFEASVPQRAALVERTTVHPDGDYPDGVTVDAMLDAYARDVARDCWFVTAPVALALARLARTDESWYALDASGAGVPLAPNGHDPFVLQAVCGGRAATLYAEWDGTALLPLGVVADGRYVRLAS